MSNDKQKNKAHQTVITISSESELERLRRDVFRPDMEKLHLFTQMLRANALFKKAKISSKSDQPE